MNYSPQHPNMRPVLCTSIEDVRKLAEEMRTAASLEPDENVEYVKSETVEEAENKAPSIIDQMLNLGILRFISYNGRLPVNICFTLRKDDTLYGEWNLSISHATVEGPVRVNDELASIIVKAFLEEDFQEVRPKAVWDTVRHFIKKA